MTTLLWLGAGVVGGGVLVAAGFLAIVWVQTWRANRPPRRSSTAPPAPTPAQVSWANTRRAEADVEATIIIPVGDPGHVPGGWHGRITRNQHRR